LTNTELLFVKAPAISEDARRQIFLLLLVVLAAALRIYQISLYPLTGDEYYSIAGAKTVTLNWNSIIYSSLMHFWIRLGTSEFWLRLPSAIFGTATVAILFRLGEELGGWRTGVVAGLLAATSPFNIDHSQEMRFYSLFICASAGFMLATFQYVDAKKTLRTRLTVLLAGVVLLLSHFLGALALCAQSIASVLARKSGWSKRARVSLVVGLLVLIGLPLVPGVQQKLWYFYSTHAGVTDFTRPVITGISTVNFAKAAFAGYTFIFGYHVYPFRFILVTVGLSLSGLLLVLGSAKLWKESRWRMLPFMYLVAAVAVFFVLNSVGGRVATVIGPRHVAFAWPAFIILLAIGLVSFRKPTFQILLLAVLAVNALSIWAGWQKDWTYGNSTDYRRAAAYASQWAGIDTALFHDGRSEDPINAYFPKDITLVGLWPYLQDRDVSELLRYQRLIFVADDWEPERRRGFDQLMIRVSERYSVVDGLVDYPFFEYVLDRKPSLDSSGYALRAENNQVQQPLSFYGLEFQDLRLPLSVKVKDVPLNVIGACGLPDVEGRREIAVPLINSVNARRVIFLSDVVAAGGLQSNQEVGEILVESRTGKTLTLPLRMAKETASWDKQCEPTASCQTVFQWHKRMAIVGQNSYEGAWHDFQAGLHGVALDLPEPREVTKLTIRYTANSGRLYVWGIAFGIS
jgi:hypothetical protein